VNGEQGAEAVETGVSIDGFPKASADRGGLVIDSVGLVVGRRYGKPLATVEFM
jgi:hypothetical protein